jgi:predicted RNA-binding protein with PUA-like domain
MNYWIFKCNPDKYDIDKRMADPAVDTSWRVTRYRSEVRMGDIAFIWRAGPKRGIVAVMSIESNPHKMEEPELERKYAINLNTGIMWRVKGRFTIRFLTLYSENLKKIPELNKLSVFHGFQQATNFKVTSDEGKRIMEMIG